MVWLWHYNFDQNRFEFFILWFHIEILNYIVSNTNNLTRYLKKII